MALTREMVEALTRPFDPRDVEIKVQATTKDRSRGQVVAYVDARTILDRLDEVLGVGAWHDSYEVLSDRGDEDGNRVVEVKCRLTILGVTKEDVGEGDSLKAAFSDALKRAAVKFGVGRYLYRLPKVWAELDEYGRIKDPEAVKARLLGEDVESGAKEVEPRGEAKASSGPSEAQLRMIRSIWAKIAEGTDDDIHEYASAVLGREVASLKELSRAEASKLIDALKQDEAAGL